MLTALEVALYEITYGSSAGVAGDLTSLFVPILLLLSAAKFALVAAFYMHLKQDSRLLSGLFVFPLIIATVVIVSLMVLMATTTRSPSRGDGRAAASHSRSGRTPVRPCRLPSPRCSTCAPGR